VVVYNQKGEKRYYASFEERRLPRAPLCNLQLHARAPLCTRGRRWMAKSK